MTEIAKQEGVVNQCEQCGQDGVPQEDIRMVYSRPFCKECYVSIINRRVIAYIIDGLLFGFIGGFIVENGPGHSQGTGLQKLFSPPFNAYPKYKINI